MSVGRVHWPAHTSLFTPTIFRQLNILLIGSRQGFRILWVNVQLSVRNRRLRTICDFKRTVLQLQRSCPVLRHSRRWRCVHGAIVRVTISSNRPKNDRDLPICKVLLVTNFLVCCDQEIDCCSLGHLQQFAIAQPVPTSGLGCDHGVFGK